MGLFGSGDPSTGTGPRCSRSGPREGPVRRLQVQPDGTKLAVLVQNETAVRIWDLASLRAKLAAMRLDWEDDGGPTRNGHRE